MLNIFTAVFVTNKLLLQALCSLKQQERNFSDKRYRIFYDKTT